MNEDRGGRQSLLVILDPAFAERLRAVPAGYPVWITMSPANANVVRSLWAVAQGPDRRKDITGFRFDADRSAEDRFLAELDAIELHHGRASSNAPYTTMYVRGAPLTTQIRFGLEQLGFKQFAEEADGFTARRTPEEARRLRD